MPILAATEKGFKKIIEYYNELYDKRKEILNAQQDTAESIVLPTLGDICNKLDENFNGSEIIEIQYNVTDHYNIQLILEKEKDFIMLN